MDIFQRRDIVGRFTQIHQVGVFEEPRGRFAFFRAVDEERGRQPVHIHLYTDFEDDRLYIADGHSDYGVTIY